MLKIFKRKFRYLGDMSECAIHQYLDRRFYIYIFKFWLELK